MKCTIHCPKCEHDFERSDRDDLWCPECGFDWPKEHMPLGKWVYFVMEVREMWRTLKTFSPGGFWRFITFYGFWAIVATFHEESWGGGRVGSFIWGLIFGALTVYLIGLL